MSGEQENAENMHTGGLTKTLGLVGIAIIVVFPPPATAGKRLADTTPDRVGPFTVFSTPAQYGHIDRTGRFKLVLNEYIRLCGFSEGLAAVRLPDKTRQAWGPQSWGFIDKTGKRAIEAKYQMAHDFSEGLACVNVEGRPAGNIDFVSGWPTNDGQRPFVYPVMGGKWGYIDRTGKVIAKLGTCYPDAYSEGVIVLKLGGRYGAIDRTGKTIVPGRFSALWPFHDGLALCQLSEAGSFGMIDKTGKVVIPMKFAELAGFHEGLGACRLEAGGKWGFIDPRGKVVIKPAFDDVHEFRNGLAAFERGGLWGFVNTTGKVVIKPRFTRAYSFSGDLAYVEIEDKHVDIDVTGKIVSDAGTRARTVNGRTLQAIRSLHEGLAAAQCDDLWGYIDARYQWAIPPRFAGAGAFKNGIARVNTTGCTPADRFVVGGMWRYIDRTGAFISPLEFEWAQDFREGLAVAYRGRRYGLKDANGRVIHKAGFNALGSAFTEGMLLVARSGRYGFLDTSGRFAIKPRFEDAHPFIEGLARVQLHHREGFIDKTGRLVVPPRFDCARDFKEGMALVVLDGKYGFVDKTGTMVVKPTFAGGESFSEGLAAMRTSTGREDEDIVSAYVNPQGKIVFELPGVSGFSFLNGLANVAAGTGWGAIDKTGRYVVPPIFEDPLSPADRPASFEFRGKSYRVDCKGRLTDAEKKPAGTVENLLIPHLTKDMRSKDDDARQNAIRSVGMFASARAIALLKPLMRQPNWYDCAAAADGLEMGRTGAGVEFLVQYLADKDPKVRKTARRALAHLAACPWRARGLLARGHRVPKKSRTALAARARYTLSTWEDQRHLRSCLGGVGHLQVGKDGFPCEGFDDAISLLADFMNSSPYWIDWPTLAKAGVKDPGPLKLAMGRKALLDDLHTLFVRVSPSCDIDCLFFDGLLFVSTPEMLDVLAGRQVAWRRRDAQVARKDKQLARFFETGPMSLDQEVDLDVVLTYLKEVASAVTGCDVGPEVDWKSLSKVNMDKNTKVRFYSSRHMTFLSSLRLFIMTAGRTGTLDYRWRGKKLIITTAATARIKSPSTVRPPR